MMTKMALRSLAISASILLLWGVSPAWARQDIDLQHLDREFRKVVSKAAPSVVDVQVLEESLEVTDGKTAALRRTRLVHCSGVVGTKSGEIITLLRDGLPQPREGGEIVIEVTLHDGQVISATLGAIDVITGVALLELSEVPRGLKPATARSGGVTPGSLVVALTTSSETTTTAKFGWVSSVDRRVRSEAFSFPRAILTDIPVQPGAVGGMLANARGEMIGLLAFSYSSSQGRRPSSRKQGANVSQIAGPGPAPASRRGTVMAIPSDLLKTIRTHLRKHGRVIRGALEGSFEFRTARELQRLGFPGHQPGAQCIWVGRDGPAARGGLRPGDIVLQVDDRVLKTRKHLNRFAEAVEFGKVGSPVALKVLRADGDFPTTKVLQLRIGKRRETVRNLPQDRRD